MVIAWRCPYDAVPSIATNEHSDPQAVGVYFKHQGLVEIETQNSCQHYVFHMRACHNSLLKGLTAYLLFLHAISKLHCSADDW